MDMLDEVPFKVAARPLCPDVGGSMLIKGPIGGRTGPRRPRPGAGLLRVDPDPPWPITSAASSSSKPVAWPDVARGLPSSFESCRPAVIVDGDIPEAISDFEGLPARGCSRDLQKLVASLQATCDRQARELIELRAHRVSAAANNAADPQHTAAEVLAPPAAPVAHDEELQKLRLHVQELQRELQNHQRQQQQTQLQVRASAAASPDELERQQEQQLETLHREASAKARELRRAQESIQYLRAELQQEKSFAEQCRDQVDGLERQVADAAQKHHRAEEERALLAWRLRACEGLGQRPSTQCTTARPSTGRIAKAWGEKPAGDCRSLSADLSAQDGVAAAFPWAEPVARQHPLQEHDGSSLEDAESVESDGSEDLIVYHPPKKTGRF